MNDTNTKSPAGSQARGYEGSDARVGPVLFGAALLGSVIVACLFVGHWMVTRFEEQRQETARDNPLAGYQAHPEESVLQAETSAELKIYRAEIEDLSSSYGWVDQPNGIVRIPLERALQLTLERGLPTADNAPRY